VGCTASFFNVIDYYDAEKSRMFNDWDEHPRFRDEGGRERMKDEGRRMKKVAAFG